MHTKKTNNTNKLIQINYHSILTKIQKLQNFKIKNKNKNKNFFLYRLVRTVPAGIAQNWPVWPVFFPIRNKGVECIRLLADTVYSGRTGRYGTELTTLPRLLKRLSIYWLATSIIGSHVECYKTNCLQCDVRIVTPLSRKGRNDYKKTSLFSKILTLQIMNVCLSLLQESTIIFLQFITSK